MQVKRGGRALLAGRYAAGRGGGMGGGIRYHRGTVEMLDRTRLEAASCECYEVIRRVYDGLYD